MSVIETHRSLAGRAEILTNGCHVWKGKTNQKGYGRLMINRRELLAHRVAWEHAHGRIPDGLCVLHRCDTPPCINPAHLFLGTIADNNADMKAKGRDRKATGERAPSAKLTSAEITEIRRRGRTAELFKDIAAAFGVHPSHVSRICRGRTRTHDGL